MGFSVIGPSGRKALRSIPADCAVSYFGSGWCEVFLNFTFIVRYFFVSTSSIMPYCSASSAVNQWSRSLSFSTCS